MTGTGNSDWTDERMIIIGGILIWGSQVKQPMRDNAYFCLTLSMQAPDQVSVVRQGGVDPVGAD